MYIADATSMDFLNFLTRKFWPFLGPHIYEHFLEKIIKELKKNPPDIFGSDCYEVHLGSRTPLINGLKYIETPDDKFLLEVDLDYLPIIDVSPCNCSFEKNPYILCYEHKNRLFYLDTTFFVKDILFKGKLQLTIDIKDLKNITCKNKICEGSTFDFNIKVKERSRIDYIFGENQYQKNNIIRAYRENRKSKTQLSAFSYI